MTSPELYKYTIKKTVGKNLCYTLYEAVDQIKDNQVFLKVLDEDLSKNENDVIHFLNSARISKLLDNPNIYKVYDYGSDQGNHYMASEPVEWQPFSSIIKETFALSFQDLIEIFIRIGNTLRYAHLHGLIHGFLNPKNIYLNSDGSIKIDDFGFDWYINKSLKNENRDSLFLSQYISPELYEEKSTVDGRVDIYSLGVILFHTVNGVPPFTGNTISAIQKQHLETKLPTMNLSEFELPAGLESIIFKTLDKNSASRFQNLKEFIDALDNLKRNVLSVSKKTEHFSTDEAATKYDSIKTQEHYFEDAAETGHDSEHKLLTSKKFVFSTIAILILFTILFFGKDKIPLQVIENYFSKNDFKEIETTTTPVTQITEKLPVAEKLPDVNENQNTGKLLAETDNTVAEIGSTKPLIAANDNQKDPINTANSNTENKPEADLKPQNKTATNHASSIPKVESTPIKTASAKFYVKSKNKPVEASIFINNQYKGKTNKNGLLVISKLDLKKTYTAKISKEGFDAISRPFTIADNSAVFNFTIKPKLDIFGTIILDAQPKADSIFIDGKHHQGKTPLRLTLPWGDHRIRYVNLSLNKSWEQVVNLKVGQILRVKHDFAKSEFGKIAVSLKNAASFGFGYVYVDGKLWDGKPNTTPLEIKLPAGSHTIEVRREGFNSIPKDIIVVVAKNATKHVSFTFSKAK